MTQSDSQSEIQDAVVYIAKMQEQRHKRDEIEKELQDGGLTKEQIRIAFHEVKKKLALELSKKGVGSIVRGLLAILLGFGASLLSLQSHASGGFATLYIGAIVVGFLFCVRGVFWLAQSFIVLVARP